MRSLTDRGARVHFLHPNFSAYGRPGSCTGTSAAVAPPGVLTPREATHVEAHKKFVPRGGDFCPLAHRPRAVVLRNVSLTWTVEACFLHHSFRSGGSRGHRGRRRLEEAGEPKPG